jgi:hypothetical protein
MAMLQLLGLCDSSGTHHSFYDDLQTLLRWHLKKGFIVSKAKGWDSFLSDMRKMVRTPQPRTTIFCLVIRLFTFLSLKCSMIY